MNSINPIIHPPGCQYRGPLRAPCSDIFPPGSAILPESHQEGHSSGPSLDTSNCGPLCCVSALQGAGCDSPGTVPSVGAKVLADVWEQFDTAKKYSEKVRFSPTTCPLFQNCNDTPLENFVYAISSFCLQERNLIQRVLFCLYSVSIRDPMRPPPTACEWYEISCKIEPCTVLTSALALSSAGCNARHVWWGKMIHMWL